MRNFGRCETQTGNPKVPCKEKRASIYFITRKGCVIRKIKVDGCVFRNETCCDYLVVDHNDIEHFVELKGSKVSRAFEQLAATIKKLSDNPSGGAKCAYVICFKNPLGSTEIQVTQANFKRDYNATLYVEKPGYKVIL